MMDGSYCYTMHIIQANTFEEACAILLTKEDAQIRDYAGYDPKNDADYGYVDHERQQDISGEEEHRILVTNRYSEDNGGFTKWAKNNYERALYLCASTTSISGNKYLRCRHTWFDWIEIECNVPEGFAFCDGHNG